MTVPMDPSASTAASLLAGTALGSQDQLAAWPGLAHLVALIHQIAAGDPSLHAALAAVSAAPEDPGPVATLAYAVDALASRDTGLRAELARLLDQAQQNPAARGLVTQIAGHARVGKLVTIGRAGAIHVHLPPVPSASVLDQLPRIRAGPLVANLPPRNSNFTGRADLLDQLRQRLHSGQPAAVVQVQAQTLHGLGGVGKTQLALEYAHRHQADYDLIWWVTAEQPAAIPGQLVALARRLGLPEQTKQAETIGALWDALRQRDRWLLVFDNAEDPADLLPWWPPDFGRVLVTSRYPNWAGPASTLVVDVLPRPYAVAFLRHRLGRDDPDFDQLAAALGDLPLALEQAAAYVEETHTPPGEYLELLGTRARELFALGRPATSERTIATIWSMALGRLHSEAPAAEHLLSLCAFLAPDEIPRWLLQDYPHMLPEPLARVVQDQLDFQQALGTLGRYALAAITDDAISVHRLVQAVVRHQLSGEQRRQWIINALLLVNVAFPGQPDQADAWPVCARLLPHALVVANHASVHDVAADWLALLISKAGVYLWGRAEYAQAEQLHKRALAIYESHFGADHPDTASSLNNLGGVLHELGDLNAARQCHERALAIYERLGSDHPSTATSLNNLALVLRDQGDLDGARTCLERALAIREARLGRDHPDTSDSLNNLGGVLAALGDSRAARNYFERAFTIRKARLGPDHNLTAQTLGNLGGVLHAMGDLKAARQCHERALAIYERLGSDHPSTATSLNNLALVLRDQGDLDGARTCLERALAIREARLGRDHPETLVSLNNLALTLRDLGDPDTACQYHQRALAIREARLGPEHPDTAHSLNNLGGVLHAQGDLDRARTLYERALAIYKARRGPDHPLTVRSRQRLAAVVKELENRQ
jgi:tetratricopeptide (TPR) repeat protein